MHARGVRLQHLLPIRFVMVGGSPPCAHVALALALALALAGAPVVDGKGGRSSGGRSSGTSGSSGGTRAGYSGGTTSRTPSGGAYYSSGGRGAYYSSSGRTSASGVAVPAGCRSCYYSGSTGYFYHRVFFISYYFYF